MSKKPKLEILQAPRGTFDVMPENFGYYEKVLKAAKKISAYYGYRPIETPAFEDVKVFLRTLGKSSDVIEKQMYSFRTRGGDELVLRPEGTAPVIRSYIENGMSNLPSPVKFYYHGSFFRHESPQRGRYRQFRQFGLEIIGEKDPVYDAQIIQIMMNICKEVGLKDLYIQINSVGCRVCRATYRSALMSYYKSRKNKVCVDCRRRLKENPLRVLDCKEEKCAPTKTGAPHIIDYLCEDCKNHFTGTLNFLDALALPYILNPHLVRGLDYYTKTVFEIFPEGEAVLSKKAAETTESELPDESAKKTALGAGGRYDSLAELMGGKPVPAAGGALGLERIVALMKEKGVKPVSEPKIRVFMIQLGEMAKKKLLSLIEEFRKTDILAAESLGRDSIKSQLKIANKMECQYALIIGQKEAIDNTVIVRDMTSGIQETIPAAKILEYMKKRLKK